MALQQINWTQIDTPNVPSGSIIDLGAIDGPLNAVYAKNLNISGLSLNEYINENNQNALTEINLYTSSLKEALETTGSNLTVIGNLLVKGTTTTINSTVIELADNILSLNGSEGSLGGLYVNDPTSPNTISGSLLWDSVNDYWIAGPSGSEQKVILNNDLNAGIWRETGSFFATTNELQLTGSMVIKGDLRVEGTTTLVQTTDNNIESLIVSGAMSIVRNEINSQMAAASLTIQNLGTLADRNSSAILDCGDGFF
jgi:hypothetical protein